MLGGELQMLGQLIQIAIITIMTIIFVVPLLKSQKLSQQSVVLKDVVLRTAVGSAIHVTATCTFVLLLFEGEYFQSKFGTVGYDMSLNLTTTIPTLFHIALSHRDDKPLVYMLRLFVQSLCEQCTPSERRVLAPRRHLVTYRDVARDAFETENNEVKRLGDMAYLMSTSEGDSFGGAMGSMSPRDKHVLSDVSVFGPRDNYSENRSGSAVTEPDSSYSPITTSTGSIVTKEEVEEGNNYWGRW
jgi:hypothetical protein